jgi:hypothetical protein
MKTLTGVIVLFLAATLTPETTGVTASTSRSMASATCFCKISMNDLTNQNSASGVLLDLTGAVNKTYTGLFPQNDSNQTDCNTRCTNTAASYTGNQSIAASACAAGAPNGTVIRAWSAVGTKEYKSAQQIGVLINQPQVTKTTCTCPATWACNGCSPQVAGGVTTDGKCKKLSCQPFSISPFPPDGTQVGAWGFTWGNALYAWGTTANGGAPNCVTTVVSPAVCKF